MIYGTDVVLCAIEECDLPKMLEYRNDPDLRRYFREYRELTLLNQKQWWMDKVVNKNSNWVYFTIKLKNDLDNIIGMTGLTDIHPVNRSGELAIVIGDYNYRDKGYDKMLY